MQTGVRLPVSILKAFRVACALRDTTSQEVLAQAVIEFIKSAGVEIKSDTY